MRTDDELKELGRDLHAGRLFTDQHLRPGDRPEMLLHIFMPLALMEDDQWERWKASGPHVIFEYLDKAGPRSINGYPTFLSVQALTEAEWTVVLTYYYRLKEASDAL